LAGLVDAYELDVEEERLIDELRILQHEVESALAGEGRRLGPYSLVARIVLRVADLRRHHQLAHAALCHADHALLDCRHHDTGAQFEAQELVVLAVELAQLLGLERAAEVSKELNRRDRSPCPRQTLPPPLRPSSPPQREQQQLHQRRHHRQQHLHQQRGQLHLP